MRGEIVSKSQKTTFGFTRRNFIKGAAILSAAGALSGCANQADNLDEATDAQQSETAIYAGVCRGNCAGGCFLDVHVRDGQVVRTTARDLPDTAYNRICSKGITHVGRIYSAKRVQYPMKRSGERGLGQFERISWDEAIDTIVKNWTNITDKNGPGGMAIMSASGNYGMCSGVGMASFMDRFINVMGCSTIDNTVDQAHGRAFGIITGMTPYGTSNEPADLVNAKTIICWGANPSISQPHIMHFISEAKEAGARYIVIDPMFNPNAAKADWYIPVAAGTDGALAFGALNELIAQDWVDIEFARAHTESPLLIKANDGMLLRMSDLGVEPIEGEPDASGQPTAIDPYAVWDESTSSFVALEEAVTPAISGVSDAQGIAVTTTFDNFKAIVSEYTPEYVEGITGISAADIREIARIYAQDGPVSTYSMFGLNHYVNGHYNYWGIYALSFLTGNVGAPGKSCGFAELIPSNVANFVDTLYPVDSEGNMPIGSAGKVEIMHALDVVKTGKNQGQDLPIKGVYVVNANPVTNAVDRNYTTEWLNAMEFVVVAEQTMTETAMYADILLPAAHWFEQTEMFVSYSSAPFIEWNEKAIEPLYESKNDFQIYKLLAEGFGKGELFDMTEEEYIKTWLDNEGARAMGITFEKMKEEKAAKVLPGEPFVSFEGGVFGTATGRARLYNDTPEIDYNIGQEIDMSKEKEPYWEPANEAAVDSEARKSYPFHLISEHMRTRTHSQWWDVDYLKEFEPEPIVKINPEDADELGISEGDEVKVFNNRGHVVMKAVINAGAPRKTVSSPRAYTLDEFIDGHFAQLPNRKINQILANSAFNDLAVDLEKL